VQRGLSRLEKQIDTAQRDARKRWTRLLRDVSHQLGRLESEGERRWRVQSTQARREAVKLLRRLEQAIQPPKRTKATRTPAAKAARPAAAAKPAAPAAAKPAAPAAPRPAAPAAVPRPLAPVSRPVTAPPTPASPNPISRPPGPTPGDDGPRGGI
jgi:translation initiation factor IF-2